MSDDREPKIDWLVAGGAIASLATISPPAAGAAAVALGLHQAYAWVKKEREREEGPDKAE